ncbi:MAG: Zn-ribbon domain-containing OB-fold protein [Thermodesulfobacteriota bacterium]|nr:Zn-ribbon domain-containing OB-fold protein [Thermodesulfobacteriota bacterium]
MAKKEIDDRFKKFGTVSFTSTSKVNDFIDYLGKGKVMGTRCKKCNIDFFPPRADCFNCFGSDLEWFDAAEDTGKLATFSKMKYGPVGFENDLPYTIAVVDFGGYKIFGRISKDLDDDAVKIGMEMKVEANRLENDQMNFVFQKV